MSTIIETLAEYDTHLRYERRVKPSTIRAIDLSLRYFTSLFWISETTDLKASDMYIFYERMKRRKRRRSNKDGEMAQLTNAFVQKVMTHLRTYIKWLGNKSYLTSLSAADVPLWKVPRRMPTFLTKQEVGRIMQVLEQSVEEANKQSNRRIKYAAYMRRALVRMLYTTGLRNFELRSLTYDDINIPELSGTVVWKGDKFWAFTFSEGAQKKLQEYLKVRAEIFPAKKFRYLFTPGVNDKGQGLTEQGLNKILKEIAAKAWIEKNVYAHIYRHSLATHLVMDGRNVVAVRDKLRHSNISITSIYTHSNPETLRSMTKSLWWDLMLQA